MCFIENIVFIYITFSSFLLICFLYCCPQPIVISLYFSDLFMILLRNFLCYIFFAFKVFHFGFTFNPISCSLSKFLSEIFALIYQKQSILFPTNYSTFKIRFRKHDFFISSVFLFKLHKTYRMLTHSSNIFQFSYVFS